MNRSRAIFSNFLPLVLAALVLRALIPTGFMPATGGFSVEAAMCSPAAGSSGIETIGIPGGSPSEHCEYCVAPALGSPPAVCLDVAEAASLPALQSNKVSSAPARFALVRVQIPRAPPA